MHVHIHVYPVWTLVALRCQTQQHLTKSNNKIENTTFLKKHFRKPNKTENTTFLKVQQNLENTTTIYKKVKV